MPFKNAKNFPAVSEMLLADCGEALLFLLLRAYAMTFTGYLSGRSAAV